MHRRQTRLALADAGPGGVQTLWGALVRIFYDTEFVEDGRTIDLLSIGMVAEDGRELYLVVDDEETVTRAVEHPWLREHVVSHLPVKLLDSGDWDFDENHPDWHLVWPRALVADRVRDFIAATPEPELWAWYGAYDHVAYAQLFGRMIDLPEGFPMWTNDFKQEVVRLGDPRLPKLGEGEHNALADARWLRATFNWLTSQETDHAV